ncbi:MAG TPA: helix-turn-helix transcriptional regulator [Gemmatimonadales bacterium]|jgi:transcriptional regulator with XRE-family HTH domain|nr:helix-turn-helix transcriptional regulator [Gemmatimonadales bacterium]
MSQWFVGVRKDIEKSDFGVVEETALAMAQATISNAMAASGVTRAELARRLEIPRSAVTRMLSGGHNLTVKTMARAMAACGVEPRFNYEPLQWGRFETHCVSEERVILKSQGRLAPSLLALSVKPFNVGYHFPLGG